MSSQLARLQLARLQLARLRQKAAIALEPEDARREILTATLPEARAIRRIDREPTPRAVIIDVLSDDKD
jgi:hypothetical protein